MTQTDAGLVERLRLPVGTSENDTTGETKPLFDPVRIEAADFITDQAEEIARLREENSAKDERISAWKAAAEKWRDETAAFHAKARTLAGKPGDALGEEELSTIEACVRNDQHGRILGLEIMELVRSYRAARSLYLELGGEDV